MPRRQKSWLHRRLKLSHHKHTAKHLRHAETSFGVLLIIVSICGGLLFFAARASAATSSSLSGSLVVSGVVEPTAENSRLPHCISLLRVAIATTTSKDEPKGICPPSSGAINYGSWNDLQTLWILFVVAFGVVASFWLGEHFEDQKMHKLWKTRKA